MGAGASAVQHWTEEIVQKPPDVAEDELVNGGIDAGQVRRAPATPPAQRSWRPLASSGVVRSSVVRAVPWGFKSRHCVSFLAVRRMPLASHSRWIRLRAHGLHTRGVGGGGGVRRQTRARAGRRPGGGGAAAGRRRTATQAHHVLARAAEMQRAQQVVDNDVLADLAGGAFLSRCCRAQRRLPPRQALLSPSLVPHTSAR